MPGIDLQSVKAAKFSYDLRREIENDLGAPLERNSQTWVWYCPFHDEKSAGGFHVYKNGYHCFSCGAHGDIYDWRSFWRKQPLADVLRGEGFNPQALQERAAENAKRLELELAAKIAEAQAALDELRKANRYLEYHERVHRDYWREMHLDDWWIDYWKLGYCETFTAWTRQGKLTTPTHTIPIFASGWELQNIRHRLINQLAPGDKYRPERSGLPAMPFMADPETGWGVDTIIVVEGEKKAMSVFVTLDDPKAQVIGIPGKTNIKHAADSLAGREPVVILDPDATLPDGGGKDAYQRIAEKIGKIRTVKLPSKIDDAIIEHNLSKGWLQEIIRNARVQ